ncbi:MAG: UDP-N-acetylglucosamine 2-epimerase (non-hydrolyzing) [Verrucomicrobiales bacterium]|nr:UDP-N-acetylglucosamine 2-epimerase (non-hydrolyzing) [Verrucomicrobiales bacterium]|tara:strand:+ start:41564 stop:42634 length:1071 start_codon:yes stop_codon:yes gene_type:complete
MGMRVFTVIGARPQFIKASVVSRALSAFGVDEFLVHTGQHYDEEMSAVFFEELGLARPAVNLRIGSGSHGKQTGEMMMGLEEQLCGREVDWVLVYGDTNSTLAAALVAVKMGLRVAHVEAGLRSYNRQMPEEHNRVLTDRCSELLFCPTSIAVENLKLEGIAQGVHLVGDVMFEASQIFRGVAKSFESDDLPYLLATIHRPQNTDNAENLNAIVEALNACGRRVILPMHPRTSDWIERHRGLGSLEEEFGDNVRVIPPVGYLEMLALIQDSEAVLTDSGGIQKEACWLGTPCITLREETEWGETVDAGWNELVGASRDKILMALSRLDGDAVRAPLEVVNDAPAAEMVRLMAEACK